jgi:serine/threonine protein kinase
VRVLKESALGMIYLHSRKPAIIHRDMKSGNILLTEAGQAKVRMILHPIYCTLYSTGNICITFLERCASLYTTRITSTTAGYRLRHLEGADGYHDGQGGWSVWVQCG